jgi:spore maturation protein CgeB
LQKSDFPTWFVAAEFWDGATGRALADGLRQLETSVVEVDKDRFFLGGVGLPLRLAARLLRPMGANEYNRALLSEIEADAPSCLLIVKGEHLKSGTVRASAKRGTLSMLYYPDMHFAFPYFDEHLLEAVDIVCTTKRFQLSYLERIRAPGTTFLVQHGYSAEVHVPLHAVLGEDDFLYDITYAGNPDRYKLQWLLELVRCFPDKRIAVAGHRWNSVAKGTALAKHVLGRAVVGQNLARLHQRSRVNIAIHGGAESIHGWQDEVSTRTFEIPACRGFMLHIDNREVRHLYDVPGEIDTFATSEEMCAKIAHYLARPEQRSAMIEAAYRRAVPAYSYESRAQEIRSIAAARSRPNSTAPQPSREFFV